MFLLHAELLREVAKLNREIDLLEGQIEDKENRKKSLARAINQMEEQWRSMNPPHSSH